MVTTTPHLHIVVSQFFLYYDLLLSLLMMIDIMIYLHHISQEILWIVSCISIS